MPIEINPGFCPSITTRILLALLVPGTVLADGININARDATTLRQLDAVSVVATSRDGTIYRAVTGREGSAMLDALPDGFYSVRVDRPGYAPAEEPVVRVIEGRTVTLDFELISAPDEIEEIVVVARAREADPYGSVSDRFLSRDELRNAPGSGSDVMRALNGLPGLVSNGDFASFSVRGHGPKDNLIFVDGFPLQQVVHFEQTLGEEEDVINGGRYSIFAPNAVAGAEFSPGGWSAEYGGRNASLLKFEVANGMTSPVASVRLDLAGIEFLYDGPSGLDEDTSMFVQARRFDFGQFFEIIDEEDLGAPVSTDVIVKTATRLDDGDELEFLLIYAPEEYTRDVEDILAGEVLEDLAVQEDEQDLTLFGATWRQLFGDDGVWTNRFYYSARDKVSSEGEAYPDLVPPGTPAEQVPVRERLLTVREDESEIGWRSDVSFGNRLGLFTAGIRVTSEDIDYSTELREDWIRYIYESDDPRPPGANYIVLEPANINSVYNQSETNYSLYGEQVFEWGAANLRAGIRYDRDGFSDENLVSPRLGFSYDFAPRIRFSANAGIFYESPGNLIRAADPDNFNLENEELIHFSAGFDYRLTDNINLTVEAYYQDLDNLLVESGRTDGRFTNDGDGSNTGVDVVLSRKFDNGWSADVVYSWNRYRVDDNDGRGSYDWDFNREHFFSIGGRWEINDRWQIAGRWRYGSGQPVDRFIVHDDVLAPNLPVRFSKEITLTNAERSDSFNTFDFRVDYRRPWGPVDFVMFLDVINVFGSSIGLEPGFNVLTGANLEEEEETLPLLGLIVEYAW